MGNGLRTLVLIATVGMMAGGCALRLGGAGPEEYNVVALRVDPGTAAATVANRILEADGDIALLTATGDSAWLTAVAAQTGLTMHGPGTSGGNTMAFLTDLELLGDTTLAVPIPAGGRLHIHDALFEVSEGRALDLMLVSFDEAESTRDGVRTLLNYIATDVGGTSALLIGVDARSPAVADSASQLIRAAFRNVLDCNDDAPENPAGGLGIALFYGPEARMNCESSRILPGTTNGIVARVVVGR